MQVSKLHHPDKNTVISLSEEDMAALSNDKTLQITVGGIGLVTIVPPQTRLESEDSSNSVSQEMATAGQAQKGRKSPEVMMELKRRMKKL